MVPAGNPKPVRLCARDERRWRLSTIRRRRIPARGVKPIGAPHYARGGCWLDSSVEPDGGDASDHASLISSCVTNRRRRRDRWLHEPGSRHWRSDPRGALLAQPDPERPCRPPSLTASSNCGEYGGAIIPPRSTPFSPVDPATAYSAHAPFSRVRGHVARIQAIAGRTPAHLRRIPTGIDDLACSSITSTARQPPHGALWRCGAGALRDLNQCGAIKSKRYYSLALVRSPRFRLCLDRRVRRADPQGFPRQCRLAYPLLTPAVTRALIGRGSS